MREVSYLKRFGDMFVCLFIFQEVADDLTPFTWAIYNDLSRGHPKSWFSKGVLRCHWDTTVAQCTHAQHGLPVAFDSIWPHLTPCGVEMFPACEEEVDDQGQVASSDVSRLPVVFFVFSNLGKNGMERTLQQVSYDGMIYWEFFLFPVGFSPNFEENRADCSKGFFWPTPLPPNKEVLVFSPKKRHNKTQQDFSKLVTWGTFGLPSRSPGSLTV